MFIYLQLKISHHKFLNEFKEARVLDRRTREFRKESVDYLRVGLKDTKLNKEKWMEVGKVRELYPHLLNK